MVDDVATPLNPPTAHIEEQKLEKTLLDVNVSQRSCKKELSIRMVCIQTDYFAWDC